MFIIKISNRTMYNLAIVLLVIVSVQAKDALMEQ